MRQLYTRLGYATVRHRWLFIVSWVLVVAVASVGALQVSSVLHGGSSDVPGSRAQLVERLRRNAFTQQFPYTLLVTIRSSQYSLDKPELPQAIRRLQRALEQLPYVGKTFSYLDQPDVSLRSADGLQTVIAVGLKVSQFHEAEQSVPKLRQALRSVIQDLRTLDPQLTGLVTGEAAISYDLGLTSAEDSTRAELRAIPLTILFLLLAFGALIASVLPIVIGVSAVAVTLGLIYVIGHFVNLSPFIHNVSTMIGLGIGIDYSLFLLTRFRESLDRGMPKEEAVVETVQTAGLAITYSGLAVITGFAALLLARLRETVAISLGGIIVVAVTILLSVTLLPALLAVFGRSIEFPRALSSRLERWRFRNQHFWYTWARLVMEHPKKFFGLALFLLLALAWPVTNLHFAALDIKNLPERLEARQGIQVLEGMADTGMVTPIILVLRTTDGSPLLNQERVGGLYLLSQYLHEDRRLGKVHSLVDLPGFTLPDYLFMYSNEAGFRQQWPEVADLFLSKDSRASIMHVLPRDAVLFELTRQISRELQQIDLKRFPGLENTELIVGGTATSVNEVEDTLASKFPMTVILVVFLTYLTLMVAFRSFLLPLKAIIMNALSVLAAYGALVLVFQEGWGAWLLGISKPPGAILSIIPIVLFTVIFGLSMDYEVFLISRIREAYDTIGDNREATAVGLALTGGIITSAASIMVIVFGAFTMAEIILVKETGFGLAVAVFIDATIVRLILVPAFMRLAGRWNWIYWRGIERGGTLMANGLGQFEHLLARRPEESAAVAESGTVGQPERT